MLPFKKYITTDDYITDLGKIPYKKLKKHAKKSKINLFEQSPIIDIISISFNDGDIFLFNIKKNKIILKKVKA